MQGAEVVNVDVFKYLGSNIKSNGQHTSEVSNENRQSHWLGVTRMDRIKCITGRFRFQAALKAPDIFSYSWIDFKEWGIFYFLRESYLKHTADCEHRSPTQLLP